MLKSINVGCGPDFRRPYDVYVDRYTDPVSRMASSGAIQPPRGVRFVVADIEALPFIDQAFEHATCTDVLEHIEDPSAACEELMRVASAGFIRCPGVFDEIFFGKRYHKWMTMMRGRKVWFFRKRPWEDRPFRGRLVSLLHPGDRNFVPLLPELHEIKAVYDADGPDWKLFGQSMHWRGAFVYEVIP